MTEDIATEREAYAQSRQGLDSLQKKLQDESTARQVLYFKPLFQKEMVRSASAHTLRNTLRQLCRRQICTLENVKVTVEVKR